MKKKLIALDLDDTTLCSDGTLSAETEAAIRRAIDERFEVVIASGRAFTALPESVIKIPGIRYGVTSNGAAVNSIVDGKRILSNTIGEEDITEALKVIDKFYDGIGVEAFIEGVPYSGREHVAYPERYGCSKAYIHYVQSTRTPVDDIRGFIKEHIHEIDSLDIACPDEVQREEMKCYTNVVTVVANKI